MLLGQMRRDLRQEGGFSDAGIAADQDERAAHDAAAQHDVQLGNARGDALIFFVLDLREGKSARNCRAHGLLFGRG